MPLKNFCTKAIAAWLGCLLSCLVTLVSISTAPAEIITVKERTGTAIAAAMQRAQAGDTVQVPEGTFDLAEPIRPNRGPSCSALGRKRRGWSTKAASPASSSASTAAEDVEIAHMTLDGENNPLVHQGISGSDSRRLWLHDLTIRNLKAKTWGPHGILLAAA